MMSREYLPEFKNSDVELKIPSLANPLPAKLLPSVLFQKDSLANFLEQARALAKARGILVNTFFEFESSAVNSLSNGKTPPIYPVGPIVNAKSKNLIISLDLMFMQIHLIII